MTTSQNPTCPPCSGDCKQGRACPASVAHARALPPEFRSPWAALLTGFVAGLAVSSALVLVGVTL